MSTELPAHDPQIALASLCFTGDGSRPPTIREIFRGLERSSPEERWKILFALILDLTRKSAYQYEATRALATQLGSASMVDIPYDSPVRTLARQILDHEARLQVHRADENWSLLVAELVGILDVDLNDEAKSIERTNLLEAFAAPPPS